MIGDLPAARNKEKELIDAGTPVPSDDQDKATPPALAKLRQLHRAQCERADDDRARKSAPIVRKYDLLLQKIEAKAIKDAAAEQALQLKLLRSSMVGLGM